MPTIFELILIFCLLLLCLSADGQSLDSLTFRNQAISDILLVLAEIGDISIIPDETVTGTASYFFHSLDFATSLKVFLETYKLHAELREGVYYVSRIEADYDAGENRVRLHGEDVELRFLIRALSEAIERTILCDALPPISLTVHIESATPREALGILIARLDEYRLEEDESYYYIRKIPGESARSPRRGMSLKWKPSGGYSLDIERILFRDLIAELFTLEEAEYSLLMRSDIILENLHFSDKSFETLLRLILEQASADYHLAGGIYYLFEIERRDILKKLKTTVRVPLDHIAAAELSQLLPPDLSASQLMRIEKTANTVVLYGSPEEISPVEEYIRSLDIPTDGLTYHRFDLAHLSVQDALQLLPPRFSLREPKVIGGTNSFVLPLNEAQAEDLSRLLTLLDHGEEQLPIRLRYISAETLAAKLPPSVSKREIVESVDPNLIFYTGPLKRRRLFLDQLEIIDRPIPQIRYDLLVVQYQDGESLNFSSTWSNDVAEAGAETTFLGSIGQLMTLNFDIVSNFGYLFAVDLSLDMAETRASIMADTTLNGLSGEDLKFQNTNTYRYRDYEIDPDTGETRSTGITRELTSGLIISLNGWVSGDGMITMEVSATVSKQGSDSSSGSPPTTTEKVVSSHVRTPSGKPVVIGGLIQQDEDYSTTKIPILGDIPLLGLLFQNRVESIDTTEMVIYVVPHIEHPEREAASRRDEALRIYTKYLAENSEE